MAPQKKNYTGPPTDYDPNDFGPAEYNPNDFGPPEPATQPPDVNAHAPQSDLVSRFTSAMGIPASMDELKNMGMTFLNTIPELSRGPDPMHPGLATAFTSNIGQQGQEMMDSINNAPVGEKAVVAGKSIPKFLLKGPLAPLGGGAFQNLLGEGGDWDQDNLAGATGDVLGILGNALLAGKAPGASTEDQLNKLTAAVGPKAAKPLAKVIDTLNDAKDSTGAKVESVGDLKDLVNKTKDNINTEYYNALGPYAKMQIHGHPIADAIRTLITPGMDIDRAGKAEKAYINSKALEYEKPIPLGSLDSKRTSLASDLSKFNAKESVDRYIAQKGDLNVAIDSKILQTLRDEIYPRVDVMAGKPSGYFENLKSQQANMMQLESLMNKRIDELTGQTRVVKGTPLTSKIHGGIGVSSNLTPHGYLNRFMGLLPENPLGTANTLTEKAMNPSSAPISKSIVLSYPARAVAQQQPTPWWDTNK